MARARRGLARAPLAALVAVAGLVIALAQTILGESVGPAGLLVLPIIAIAIVRATTARSMAWPEATLVVIALSLAIAVLVGFVAALAPRGLSATTTGALEFVLLAAALAVRLWRPPAPVTPRPQGPPPGISAPRTGGISARAVGLTLAGILLGGAGFGVAAYGAQTQAYAGYVQFFAVPASSGSGDVVGVSNGLADSIQCRVSLVRPQAGTSELRVPDLPAGGTWTNALPHANAGETVLWKLTLSCTAADGSSITRSLTIAPAA
ncbi:MAG TPA: hypothetical protein VFW20_02715 [Candidatus Limnocylindrales bacterium]|nr:hypothetical protein [Candidatus Limnocylindrales bacterium]